MAEVGDATYETWEQLHAQARYLPRYPQDDVVRWVLGGFTKTQRQKKSALDLGCGGGRHTILMAREGFNTKAIDRSPVGIAETKRRAKEEGLDVECINSNLTNLPYDDKSFDAVLCYGVICYLEQEELQAAIGEIYRILKSGGQTFIMTRSNKDFRVNYSRHLGGTTYRIIGSTADDYPAKGENGMLHSFLGQSDVHDLFCNFQDLRLDRRSLSFCGGTYINDDWLILAKR